MAGSISHIVLAEKLLDGVLQGKDPRRFILGNVFPDIRYLNVIERSQTHYSSVTIADIQNTTDDFQAGLLTHSLIDQVRESYVEQTGIYNSWPNNAITRAVLKLSEDLLLHSKSSNWSTYQNYLQTIFPEESRFNIPQDALQKWHQMNTEYFMQPSTRSAHALLLQLGFGAKAANQIIELVHKLNDESTVESYINDFYDTLEQQVQA